MCERDSRPLWRIHGWLLAALLGGRHALWFGRPWLVAVTEEQHRVGEPYRVPPARGRRSWAPTGGTGLRIRAASAESNGDTARIPIDLVGIRRIGCWRRSGEPSRSLLIHPGWRSRVADARSDSAIDHPASRDVSPLVAVCPRPRRRAAPPRRTPGIRPSYPAYGPRGSHPRRGHRPGRGPGAPLAGPRP